MHLEVPHFSKTTWIILIAGAVALGLYFRHKASSNSTGDTSNPGADLTSQSDLPNLPDSLSPYDTVSGYDNSSGGYSYSGPPNPHRILPKPNMRPPHKQHKLIYNPKSHTYNEVGINVPTHVAKVKGVGYRRIRNRA